MPQIAALLTGGLAGGTPSFLLTLGLGPFSTPTLIYPDLVAAVLGTLAADAGVATSFGHATSTPKFQGDLATATPSLPYLVTGEPADTREYFAGGNYLDRGEIQIHVYAAAKLQARQLGTLAAAALNDADLQVEDLRVLRFRVRSGAFTKLPAVVPGGPAGYLQVLSVDYLAQGAL